MEKVGERGHESDSPKIVGSKFFQWLFQQPANYLPAVGQTGRVRNLSCRAP
jgi:hypothetical protein